MSHKCDECLCKKVCSRYPCFYPELCRHSMFNDKVIRLPCKIGDTVYRISDMGNGKGWHTLERVVTEIHLFQNDNHDIGFILKTTRDDVLGQTVFLSEIEAEGAIRRLTSK